MAGDLSARVVLVTGATDGLGKGIVHELARRGATILVHGRDSVRAHTLAEALRRDGAQAVRVYLADFSSLFEVKQMADAVRASESRIDVLVNNAGIGTTVPTAARAVSRDGYELRFAVNYLSHFLLTRELLPVLKKSAPARVVNVSSAGQTPLDFTDPMLERGYTGVRAYCQSKLAQILMTVEMAHGVLKDTGVTMTALHPATYMPTKIVPNPISTIEEGVRATMQLMVDPSTANETGTYFDGLRKSEPDAQAHDARARAQLTSLSQKLVSQALNRHL